MNSVLEKNAEQIKAKKTEIFLQIIVVFIFPIFLLKAGVISLENRVWVLDVSNGLLLAVLIVENWNSEMLGVNFKNIKKSILPYLIFTIIGIFCLYFLSKKLNYAEIDKWWSYDHFLYLFFVVSMFQEIAYRGYLVPALVKIFSKPFWVVLINSFLFMLLHVIFPEPKIMLPLAFLGGIGFSLMYLRYPNLLLIIMSHSILNFYAVLYGFFTIPGITH